MCHCARLPLAVSEIHESLPGARFSSLYFELPDAEYFDHSVTWEQREYECTICGQAWYGEAVPEEVPELRFAMKIQGTSQPPSEGAVRAAKDSLCVIAHGGFEDQLCKVAGCENLCLKGRYVCHRHS
jgi:hypothetical protein